MTRFESFGRTLRELHTIFKLAKLRWEKAGKNILILSAGPARTAVGTPLPGRWWEFSLLTMNAD